MMLQFIVAPYHLGERNVAVGAGPLRVMEDDRALRHGKLQAVECGAACDWREVNHKISLTVRQARGAGALPLVLAGNCNSCLGVLAGLSDLNPGIVWFDAHGDFHTPQTSISGSVDGMALTMATQDFVPEAHVVLAGARDLDPGEAERVHQRLLFIPDADLDGQSLPRMDAVYVHIDIDVLDPSVSPGANFQGAGGISVDRLRQAIAFTFSRYRVAALAIVNYNPDKDVEDRTRNIIVQLIEEIARLHRSGATR